MNGCCVTHELCVTKTTCQAYVKLETGSVPPGPHGAVTLAVQPEVIKLLAVLLDANTSKLMYVVCKRLRSHYIINSHTTLHCEASGRACCLVD